MMLPDDPWRSAPRYSLQVFEQRLAQGNPAILGERPAGEYYAKCEAYGVDPALLVEQLFKESSGGTEGTARHTKSWGNTGYPNFGPDPRPKQFDAIGLDDKHFPAFYTWLDGLEATLARLVATNWVYHDRYSLAEIFEHPSGSVWAPAKHYNDPRGYLNFLVTNINQRSDRQGAILIPPPPSVRDWIVPTSRSTVRPGVALRAFNFVTIHETDNTSDGADAESHAKLMASNPNWEYASWHVSVDDVEAIRSIPYTEITYHAGDKTGPGNYESRSMEMCVNGDGNYWATRRHAAGLAGAWLKEGSLALDRMVQHNFWARVGFTPVHKDCPKRARSEGLWPAFQTLVARTLAPSSTASATRFFRVDGELGFILGGGFRAFWEAQPDAFYIFGPPISEEFTGQDGVRRQVFQKAIFEWRPDWPAWNDWHVYTMNAMQIDGAAQVAHWRAIDPERFTPHQEG